MGRKIRTISALGLTANESNLLGSIVSMTGYRTDINYQVNADIEDADICIVNKDEPAAMAAWRKISQTPRPPVLVLYTSTVPADPNQYYMVRPFGPSKLLTLLDKISASLKESSEIWKKPLVSSKPDANVFGVPLARVLIIDDSVTVLKQLSSELQKLNIHADSAETGEDGLAMLNKAEYTFIFLDIVLPGSDGYQVCRLIRKNPLTKQTPVIMLTSKSSTFDRVRGKLVGCNEYLTKPVDYKSFREVVDKYVKIEPFVKKDTPRNF
jgi:twitching motility two-component system response regulator PilG